MHPAPSIIVFTLASGLGFGLIALSALIGMIETSESLPTSVHVTAGVLALVLTFIGLCASTFHLANPKNAWRAFSRFRTSWLSREGILALLFYPFAVAHLLLVWNELEGPSGLGAVLAAVTIALALATVFCTGMIYACLRTIRQWNTPLVPMNFVLLSLASGGALLAVICAFAGAPGLGAVCIVTLALLAAAALGKIIYYFWLGKPQGATINTATGFTRARVKLLDLGQSADSFLNKEFGYRAPAALIAKLRALVYVLCFAFPGLVLLWLPGADSAWTSLPMLLSLLAGLVVERWLFFAEGRHVVNLFFGQQQT